MLSYLNNASCKAGFISFRDSPIIESVVHIYATLSLANSRELFAPTEWTAREGCRRNARDIAASLDEDQTQQGLYPSTLKVTRRSPTNAAGVNTNSSADNAE